MAQQNTNGKRKSTIKKVWHYLKNYRFLLILSILMAALTVAGTLYVPILVGDAIDFIIKKGQVNFAAIAKILEKGATVILFTGITQWIMNICNNHITFHVTRDIQNQAQLKMKSTFSHVKIFLLPPQIILRPALSQLSMYFTSFPESNLKTACHSTIMHP